MRLPGTVRARRLAFLALVLMVLTFPLVNSMVTRARVERSGVDVAATVAKAVDDDGRYLVAFTLPEGVDPDQKAYSAVVDRAAYDKARTSKQITVRVLEGRPSAHHVEGEVARRAPWIVTAVADAVVLLVGVWWVRVGRRRPSLTLLAMRDVEPVPPDEPTSLERDSGEMYVAIGPVAAVDGSTVTIALLDRILVVRLNGYPTTVGVGDTARAWGVFVG